MSEKILLTGATTSIARELKKLVTGEFVEWTRQTCDLSSLAAIDARAAEIKTCDRIVLLHGIIGSERFTGYSEAQVMESLKVNLLSFVRIAEIALEGNPRARICMLGSESGEKGSFDIPYALSKSAMHAYVTERKILHPEQQLVCIAPSTIADAGITLRRNNPERAKAAMAQNPKQRGIQSAEVASLIHHLLFVERGYVTNTVVQMNGGKFARM